LKGMKMKAVSLNNNYSSLSRKYYLSSFIKICFKALKITCRPAGPIRPVSKMGLKINRGERIVYMMTHNTSVVYHVWSKSVTGLERPR
jgi:hypothetical protein